MDESVHVLPVFEWESIGRQLADSDRSISELG